MNRYGAKHVACRVLVVCQHVDEDGFDPADKNNSAWFVCVSPYVLF